MFTRLTNLLSILFLVFFYLSAVKLLQNLVTGPISPGSPFPNILKLYFEPKAFEQQALAQGTQLVTWGLLGILFYIVNLIQRIKSHAFGPLFILNTIIILPVVLGILKSIAAH